MDLKFVASEMSWQVVRMSFRLGASIRYELEKGCHLSSMIAFDNRGRQVMSYKQLALDFVSDWIQIPGNRKVELRG